MVRDEGDEDASEERPVPVSGFTWEAEGATEVEERPGLPGWGEEEPPPSEPSAPSREVDHPLTEALVGLLAVVAAAMTFLKWYGPDPPGLLPRITGWESGTWGPVVTLLACAAVAIVVLRRAGVAMAFPVDSSLVLEGIGWLNTILVFVKRFFPVKVNGSALPIRWPLVATIFASILLALVAGRLSKSAPMVLMPGWLRAAGGRLGAGLLAGALVAGALLGFVVNPVDTSARPVASDRSGVSQVEGEPKCIDRAGLPIPRGLKAVRGIEIKSPARCDAFYSSGRSVSALVKAFDQALTAAGWTFTVGATAPGLRSITLSRPRCGTITVVSSSVPGQPEGRTVIVGLQPCAPPPSP